VRGAGGDRLHGLGPEGELHPYRSAAAEGHAVIDSVAAVRALSEANAGDEWVVAGVFQGGHSAIVTDERALDRRPLRRLVVAVSRQTSPGRPLAPTDLLPSQIFDPRRQQVDEWLDGYDPAEIQYLYDAKDESFGDISDEYLLGTLEFRRSCRFVQRAIDAAATATSDAERAEVVASILEPQIARFVERVGTEGDSDETWQRLMTRLEAGDVAAVQAYLGDSCARSFGPWVDD